MDSSLTKLLLAVLKERRSGSFTADELINAERAFLEPCFHEQPLGPVPDYLAIHGSVYGCVAEYEDKIEELDRWKVRQLNRWLKERIGGRWHVDGDVYELQAERGEGSALDRFRFRRIDDHDPKMR
jgi:hypothetical protein